MMRRRNNSDMTVEEEQFRKALEVVPPPTPPDGGWGWMVVFASFLTNAIVDGVCYSFGVLLPDFVSYFQTSTALVSLGGALVLGVYMLSGPIISALCNRFGSRRVAILGSVISTISFFSAVYSPNLLTFILLFGVCGGIGFGMMFLSSLVIVGFYFEQQRVLATTIAMCGSGFGTAFMAPFITYLLAEFEWKDIFMILCCFLLNGTVLGMIYRPIDADMRKRKKLIMRRLEEDKQIGPQTCIIMQRLLEEKRRQRTISTGSLNNVIITRDNEFIKMQDYQPRTNFIDRIKASVSQSNNSLATASLSNSPQPSQNTTPFPTHKVMAPSPLTFDVESQNADSPLSLRRSSSKRSAATHNGSVKSLVASMKSSKSTTAEGEKTFQSSTSLAPSEAGSVLVADIQTQQSILKMFKSATADSERPMYRKDIYYTGSVQQLPQYQGSIAEYVASITEVPPEQVSQMPSCWDGCTCLPKSIKDVLMAIFDPSTCQSYTFILLSVATFLTMLGYYTMFLYLPSLAIDLNLTRMEGAYLLSILGGSYTLSRAAAGVLGGFSKADGLIINGLSLLVAGVATVLVPLSATFSVLALCSATYGICVAAFSSFRSVIVVELMGLEKLTPSFSQLVLIQGLGIICGAPLSGFLSDLSGSFAATFYFSGGAIVISGILCLPLRKIADWERLKNGLATPSDDSSQDMKKGPLIEKQPDLVAKESVM